MTDDGALRGAPRFHVAIDTGGTHTDLVLQEEGGGRLFTHKVPSTLRDLSEGILEGMRQILGEAGAGNEAVTRFVYATTMVTNLIVEGVAAPVGLITTAGFRDLLQIGRASRKPDVYDIHWRPAPPVVSRPLRLGVRERIDHTGAVVEPLDEADVAAAFARLQEAGCGSVAVCFLNAYANPAHEQRVAAIAAAQFPDMEVSLSSAIVREFREYERLSTTALNAYVRGPLGRHLTGLGGALADAGILARPFIMRGNGGVSSFEEAKRLPVAVTHSGPMGGIVGGAAIAEAAGIADIVTLDMGGTSADVSLVQGNRPVVTTRGRLGPYPLLLPMLDLVTIGAGGGSIGWVEGGAMRVGPRSAGAYPGPACYGQGGRDPTVTDCNLFSGRLNGEYFLAGRRRLDARLSEEALAERLARPLGLDIEAAAMGVLAIAEAHMVNAIRLISVDRGLDPRDFTLVGFGGAGPLHVMRLAEELAISRVLVPPAPGNVSASGLLAADVRHDLVRTRVTAVGDLDPGAIAGELAEMAVDAAQLLDREEVAVERRMSTASVDLRYQGQNYELTLPLPAGELTADTLARLAPRFHEEHRRTYGYDLPARTVQLVNLRLVAIGRVASARWPEYPAARGPARPAGRRRVTLSPGIVAELPVYRATELAPDHAFEGPAIVEYPGSTLFVPPAWTVRYDRMRNAHLERVAPAKKEIGR